MFQRFFLKFSNWTLSHPLQFPPSLSLTFIMLSLSPTHLSLCLISAWNLVSGLFLENSEIFKIDFSVEIEMVFKCHLLNFWVWRHYLDGCSANSILRDFFAPFWRLFRQVCCHVELRWQFGALNSTCLLRKEPKVTKNIFSFQKDQFSVGSNFESSEFFGALTNFNFIQG